MGNSTRFIAVDLDGKLEPKRIHLFERMGYHDIWEIIIPDTAPNDLLYRFKSGPSYNLIDYSPGKDWVEIPLRQPEVEYSDTRISDLNSPEESAFDINEFRAILTWLEERINLGMDSQLDLIIIDLFEDLSRFFMSDVSGYDAIVLEYEM